MQVCEYTPDFEHSIDKESLTFVTFSSNCVTANCY